MRGSLVSGWLLAGLVSASGAWAVAEDPQKVTPCALKADPGAYDHALVEVTGFVSHGFEDFSLFDPACPPWLGVWLEYGGVAKSGTMYCCGVTVDRSRPEPLVVEKIPVPLVDDRAFRQFDRLMNRNAGILAHATLVGRFFAGRKETRDDVDAWRGYGHMGCCSLLAIQQVKTVDPADRPDIDYDPFPDQPDLGGVGCGYKYLTNSRPFDRWIAAQQEAEDGQTWAFRDPRRVAAQALAPSVGAIPGAVLKETRRTPGRIVYQWAPPGRRQTYMVVVSRPSLVTFYAREPRKIAWIAVAAYESSCEGK
jgi:hypothetical protein